MLDKVIILSLALVTLTSPDHVTNKMSPRKQYFAQFQRPYDGSETGLDPRIGHGIPPNFSPRYSPPVQTEHMPDIKDFLSFEGRLGFKITVWTPGSDFLFLSLFTALVYGPDIDLPNTWHSVPSFRYPYYDSTGRGRLLYGYGNNGDLYNYSEFDDLEGYY